MFFGLAFLLRQPAALAMPAAVLWLFLDSRVTVQRLAYMAAGFALPVMVVTAGFAVFGSFFWFFDANVAYFLFYVPTGSRMTSTLMLYTLLPSVAIVATLGLYWLRREPMPRWALPALWFAFAFVGSLINGKDYSHYLLQSFPPLVLLLATLPPLSFPAFHVTWRQPALAIAAVFAISWYVVVTAVYYDPFGRHWTKDWDYYPHFFYYVIGEEPRDIYYSFFDKRAITSEIIDDQCEALHAEGSTAYIWGEYPWVYALCGLEPFSRYVTSYYILESEERLDELLTALKTDPPRFLIIGSDAEPFPNRTPTKERFSLVADQLRAMTSQDYNAVGTAGKATVYELKSVQTVDKQPR